MSELFGCVNRLVAKFKSMPPERAKEDYCCIRNKFLVVDKYKRKEEEEEEEFKQK